MYKNIFLLHHLLDKSVNMYPDKVAILDKDKSLSYKDLDNKSTQMANALIKSGIRQREIIAVVMNKSSEMIVSMLAVLKAGCAYIPLDTHYMPYYRINKIIESSGCSNIITKKRHLNGMSEFLERSENHKTNRKIFYTIESVIKENNNDETNDNERIISFNNFDNYESNELIRSLNTISEDLAYILYTSGSTGDPKGVMISHLNAMTFINWCLEIFKPKSSDVFSSFAPFHFDLSVFDIFVSLSSGASVVLMPYKQNSNPRYIIEWAKKYDITIWYSVPSLWISIINYSNIKVNELIKLRLILFAGEVFPAKYLKKMMSLVPKASFYNLYGPTETNVCTYHKVKSVNEVTDKPVPIGIPCGNTEVIVLNNEGKLVAEGEEGELLVRGSIVTKGYFNNPKKTSEVFKKSPLNEHSGAKFYITNDIVRKVNNRYEYIGRKDLMVKCAGYRVEIQEIEAAFYNNDKIKEVVVVPYTDNTTKTTRLCAIIVSHRNEKLSIIDLKGKLAKFLPKYMIPEYIEFVNNLYKNQNGKYDRQRIKAFVTENIR